MSGPGLARTYSMSVVGIEGHLVDVETYAGAGLVAFTLVGLLDTSVREARDRVRAAFESCGLDVLDQRIRSIFPRRHPKVGVRLRPSHRLVHCAGDRPGVAQGLRGQRHRRRTGPRREHSTRARGTARRAVCSFARCTPRHRSLRLRARGATGLRNRGHCLRTPRGYGSRWGWGRGNQSTLSWAPGRAPPGLFAEDVSILDMADVRGQPEAVAAMEVAAAGGHHVFLLGEPGSGKTMLASRLPTILPDLDPDTALVTTSLHSVAGLVPTGTALVTRPPFQAPHHSVTMAALIGGGSRTLTPGAVSLAHGGILFLDEAAEFAPSVLDSRA